MRSPADNLPLPRGWPNAVRLAILHVVGLAHACFVIARGRGAHHPAAEVRFAARVAEAEQEIALLREELRIKDARLARIEPRRRPQYPPHERLAILALRAARAWSMAETARRFLVEARTIASWMGRLDEEGEAALVRTPEPVNRFPDFVATLVTRLKAVCPSMGKKRMAQVLGRAGLHLGVNTVKRMLSKRERPKPPAGPTPARAIQRPIRARRVDDVWQIDLTIVPTMSGLWVPWKPFAAIARWPLAWWVGAVVDGFSRRVVGYQVFESAPTAEEICRLLSSCVGSARRAPRYLVSDKGGQFVADEYRAWCKTRGIGLRYAATDSLRATAVIERFFLSLKREWLGRVRIPLRLDEMRSTIQCYLDWYHERRPHQGLGGRTPSEVALGLRPANEAARLEPRARWPTRAPCAWPYARSAVPRSKRRRRGGEGILLAIDFVDRDKVLPIVTLKDAA